MRDVVGPFTFLAARSREVALERNEREKGRKGEDGEEKGRGREREQGFRYTTRDGSGTLIVIKL